MHDADSIISHESQNTNSLRYNDTLLEMIVEENMM